MTDKKLDRLFDAVQNSPYTMHWHGDKLEMIGKERERSKVEMSGIKEIEDVIGQEADIQVAPRAGLLEIRFKWDVGDFKDEVSDQ